MVGPPTSLDAKIGSCLPSYIRFPFPCWVSSVCGLPDYRSEFLSRLVPLNAHAGHCKLLNLRARESPTEGRVDHKNCLALVHRCHEFLDVVASVVSEGRLVLTGPLDSEEPEPHQDLQNLGGSIVTSSCFTDETQGLLLAEMGGAFVKRVKQVDHVRVYIPQFPGRIKQNVFRVGL